MPKRTQSQAQDAEAEKEKTFDEVLPAARAVLSQRWPAAWPR